MKARKLRLGFLMIYLLRLFLVFLLSSSLAFGGIVGDTFKGAAKAGAVYGVKKALDSEVGKAAVKGVKDKIHKNSKAAEPTYKTLRKEGKKDAHHIIQDASVKQLPKYNRNDAPAIQLESPASKIGTEHHKATQAQRESGGGTYGAERRIGYKALRKAGINKEEAREAIDRADNYFNSIGVTKDTITKIPKNRKK